MKIAFILGTRPEIIKLSPVIRECQSRKIPFIIVHTNQHFSKLMDAIFFEELDLPTPNYNLGVSYETTHGAMTGKMIEKIEQTLLNEKPSVVVVQGDTNSALSGALAAVKLQIPVAHVEAGLRSYDRSMPEEINRILVDHVSSHLFAPTKKQSDILQQEGIERTLIKVTGNTIVDAVEQSIKLTYSKKHTFKNDPYILLTLHRPSNVDSKVTLQKIIKSIENVSKMLHIPIVFPIHPRTQKQFRKFGIKPSEKYINLIDSLGYLDMLFFIKKASLVITDSGGIQEEACILRVPCVTIRDTTERPETIAVGANILVGHSYTDILNGVKTMLQIKGNWKNPFGNGTAGKKIVDTLIV